MRKLISVLTQFRRDDSGASAIEYGLFAALIAAVIAGTVSQLGTDVNYALVDVQDKISARDSSGSDTPDPNDDETVDPE